MAYRTARPGLDSERSVPAGYLGPSSRRRGSVRRRDKQEDPEGRGGQRGGPFTTYTWPAGLALHHHHPAPPSSRPDSVSGAEKNYNRDLQPWAAADALVEVPARANRAGSRSGCRGLRRGSTRLTNGERPPPPGGVNSLRRLLCPTCRVTQPRPARAVGSDELERHRIRPCTRWFCLRYIQT